MRFDLHIHSECSSDSSLTVDEILKQAVERGLDGIAICDHNRVEGSLRAIERARELNLALLMIPGMEVSTSEGHVIVLGIRENIQPELSCMDTIRITRQKGGVSIAAHPFKKGGIGYYAKETDAIETFNSRCMLGENAIAKDLAQALGKPEVGGSDSHILATIGIGYTEIDADPNVESVLSAIREGKTHSYGNTAPLHVILILLIRGMLRRINRTGKGLYSKIFHESETI